MLLTTQMMMFEVIPASLINLAHSYNRLQEKIGGGMLSVRSSGS